MPASLRAMKTELRALNNPAASLVKSYKPWMRFSQAPHQRKRMATLKPNQSRISAALLPAGDPRSLLSFSQNASELTHVCIEMLSVTGQPARLKTDLDSDVLAAVGASRLHIFAILTNLAGKRWDTDAVEGLIHADDKTQQTFVNQLIRALQNIGASGVLIDWQGIDPALSAELVKSLGRMHSRLRAEHLDLWLSIPLGDDLRAFDLEDLPGVVDRLVAQLHDENAESDAPGPVASQPWFEGWLRTLMGYGEPGQWILSLGAYGYDWNTTRKKAAMISFADSMARVQRSAGSRLPARLRTLTPVSATTRKGTLMRSGSSMPQPSPTNFGP